MTQRAVSPEDVARVFALKEIGVTQRAIAKHIGVHWRTIANIIHKRGAYKDKT